jgi:hypothetical protein
MAATPFTHSFEQPNSMHASLGTTNPQMISPEDAFRSSLCAKWSVELAVLVHVLQLVTAGVAVAFSWTQCLHLLPVLCHADWAWSLDRCTLHIAEYMPHIYTHIWTG